MDGQVEDGYFVASSELKRLFQKVKIKRQCGGYFTVWCGDYYVEDNLLLSDEPYPRINWRWVKYCLTPPVLPDADDFHGSWPTSALESHLPLEEV